MTDEQWPTYEPDATPDREATPAKAMPPAKPAAQVEAERRRAHERNTRLRTRIIGWGIGVGLPLVIVVVVVLAILGSKGAGPFAPPDVLAEEGLDELRADLEERTGDTEVFGATLYPDYAVLDVPVDDTTYREEGLSWDGDFEDFGGKGTASTERIDLADLDAAVVQSLLEQVKAMVEDPDSWYVIVVGPPKDDYPFDDDGVRLRAFANNEYSESASLSAELDGTIVD